MSDRPMQGTSALSSESTNCNCLTQKAGGNQLQALVEHHGPPSGRADKHCQRMNHPGGDTRSVQKLMFLLQRR
eukprot:4425722-Pyramimonas_sp.AAC.1